MRCGSGTPLLALHRWENRAIMRCGSGTPLLALHRWENRAIMRCGSGTLLLASTDPDARAKHGARGREGPQLPYRSTLAHVRVTGSRARPAGDARAPVARSRPLVPRLSSCSCHAPRPCTRGPEAPWRAPASTPSGGRQAGSTERSILAVPVRLGNEVVGAVSIDSTRAYHFDAEIRDLVEYVHPYVCLLAWTLEKSRVKLLLKRPAP